MDLAQWFFLFFFDVAIILISFSWTLFRILPSWRATRRTRRWKSGSWTSRTIRALARTRSRKKNESSTLIKIKFTWRTFKFFKRFRKHWKWKQKKRFNKNIFSKSDMSIKRNEDLSKIQQKVNYTNLITFLSLVTRYYPFHNLTS